ncbi:hypothetical protein BHE74_00032329 [Ensete ventricosum]|nr:hypothetical protein GW17_00007869 [Ensete ventricosum]RWW60655.1 hypothetical protein BHE74_00032329 [Ensete ventricosum]
MSKAWGAVGAWALDAERAEAEERERPAGETPPASPLLASETAEGFPTLKEAASSSKQKKKKKKPVPLAQFVAGGGPRYPSFESKRLTPDEMLGLPTGPRERSQDELGYGRLGGGFRSYGDGGGPRRSLPGRRVDEGDGSWGGAGGGRRSYGGFDEEPRKGPPDRYSDFDQPSRADEVDNWGAGKKPFAPPLADAGRRDSYSFSGGGSSSRADEVDSWSTAKKPLPSDNPSFGSGFGDSRASSDSYGWGRSREGSIPLDQGRPKIVLDPPKRNVGTPSEPVRTRPSPFGAARPREEVLAQKGLDWRQMDSENEMKKTSRPTSSHSSRPSSAHSSRPVSPGLQSAAVAAEVAVKPRPKVNPFGDAKPREMLKEKINYLKSLARETEGDLNGKFKKLSAEELSKLHEEIARKEKDLELLVHQFDEKVQFGQRTTANIRPGSGSGRSDTSSTRPPSQSGMSEGSRSIDFVDRPQSGGGTGDAWGKHVDDRRGFQGRRDKSFFESRNADRYIINSIC